MIQIDLTQGINLKFKVNLTGATFESLKDLSAWANIEPADSDISYQIPATIENGVLTLKSDLENIKISEKGNIKIKVQHGTQLHDVWSSEYETLEKVQIVLEQIREEKKVEAKKPEIKKEAKKVEKIVESLSVENFKQIYAAEIADWNLSDEAINYFYNVYLEDPAQFSGSMINDSAFEDEEFNESKSEEKIFRFKDFK